MALIFTNEDVKVIGNIAMEGMLGYLPSAATMGRRVEADGTIEEGDTIKVPVYTKGGAALAFNDDTNNFGTVRNDAIEFKDVVMDQFLSRGFGIRDSKKRKVDPLELARINGQAIGEAMMTNVLSKVTAANFSEIAHTGLAANFTLDDVVDIHKKTRQLKFNRDNTWLVLTVDYIAELMKDTTLQTTESNLGLGVVMNAEVNRLARMNIIENDFLPHNNENLVGYVTDGRGLVFATDIIAPDANTPTDMIFETITHEGTGLTLGVRHFYDKNLGKAITNFSILFGSAVGNGAALARIRSAE